MLLCIGQDGIFALLLSLIFYRKLKKLKISSCPIQTSRPTSVMLHVVRYLDVIDNLKSNILSQSRKKSIVNRKGDTNIGGHRSNTLIVRKS